MNQPVSTLAGLMVLAGAAVTFYARFRYIANEPDDSPFAGRRWRALPPRTLFRHPGFPIFIAGIALSMLGVVALIVEVARW